MPRPIVLVVCCAGILYLTATQLNRSNTGGQGKTIIEKPTEAREQVNRAMDVEKARQNVEVK